MHRVHHLAGWIVGLILLLGGGVTWGGPPNPTASDSLGNTAGGTDALSSNAFGQGNTAFGADALQNNIFGSPNTAVGAYALQSNTVGNSNTAVGAYALYSNDFGHNNTAVGDNALSSNTIGSDNIASGVNALMRNTTGTGNIAVGYRAGALLQSGNNNIYVSHTGVVAESNTIRLGSVQTSTFIAGITGVPVSGNAVLINSQGQLGIQASSARYKHDIQPMGTRSRGLLQLRPVTFRYKQDAQRERQYGLIAEEVAKVYPELVTYGAAGEIESVRYQEMIPMLLNELQHQRQQLAELKTQNERLRAAVVQQQVRDAALAARLERLEAAARAATLNASK